MPVLASIDKATDLGSILEEANAGFWSYAGDTISFKKNFDKLFFDPVLRKKMGVNGHNLLKNKMTTTVAYETIMSYV